MGYAVVVAARGDARYKIKRVQEGSPTVGGSQETLHRAFLPKYHVGKARGEGIPRRPRPAAAAATAGGGGGGEAGAGRWGGDREVRGEQAAVRGEPES